MDAAQAAERVLVIPAARLDAAGSFTAFRPFDAAFMAALLDPSFFSFRPRGEVETDPQFKQIIPYLVLHCRGRVFQYTRGGSGTETRLVARRSVGIGGHISLEDARHADDPYRAGMQRELAEEIEIRGAYRERCLGFIYDPSTPVGEVHLGVVHQLDLDEPSARPREQAIANGGFAPLGDLLRDRDQFETWSQFALSEIAKTDPFYKTPGS